MSGAHPYLLGVLETVLYYGPEQGENIEQFYRDVLGLRVVVPSIGGTAFRVGEDVMLLFDRANKSQLEELAHGASGSIHTCFLAPADEYERWKEYLTEEGVALSEEAVYEGIRSFYFRDPAGNLLEIAEGDFWPE